MHFFSVKTSAVYNCRFQLHLLLVFAAAMIIVNKDYQTETKTDEQSNIWKQSETMKSVMLTAMMMSVR